jgi:hypothetical protein
VTAADEPAELAGEEEAQRLTAELDGLAGDPVPVELPEDAYEVQVPAAEPESFEPDVTGPPDETAEPIEVI